MGLLCLRLDNSHDVACEVALGSSLLKLLGDLQDHGIGPFGTIGAVDQRLGRLISVFSYDEIYEILSTTGGKAFDILRIDITFLSWFAQKLLVPLEELDPEISKILPQFLDGVSGRYSTVANTIYALPFSPSVQLLYYRKDLFESTVLRRLYHEKYKCDLQPPSNFTEFNRIAEFFTKKKNSNSPVDYGTSLTLGSFGVAGSEFMARFLESHKNLYDEDGRVRLNGSEGNLAMQQLIELKEMAPTHNNTWWTDTAEDFASGRLAMAILYSNYASDLIREGSNISELIGCTLVPGQNPILGGASLGISKRSQHPHAALNFSLVNVFVSLLVHLNGSEADTGPLCEFCLGATVGGADSLEVRVSEVFFH